MSIVDQIDRIDTTVALQHNAIDAARTLLAQKKQTQPVVEPLSVTSNGTYTAPAGVDGYSPVAVNVPSVSIPSAYGLKAIRYFDFTIQPNDTGYGFKAAGLRFFIPNDHIMMITGKNSSFTNPSASSSWQAFGMVGMCTLSNSRSGRGGLGFTTMSNGGVCSFGATNSAFSGSQTANTQDFVRAAVEGDATHQYYYFGTYRIYVFIYEKDYAGSVTVAPADSSLVIVHPDYASTCSVTYPSV